MPLPEAFVALVGGPRFAPERAAGNDQAIADALNERTRRGLVPIRELAAFCMAEGLTGAFELGAWKDGNPDQLRALCFNVLTLLRDDYRLTEADVDSPRFGAACDALVGVGLMTGAQKAALMALAAGRTSDAEAALGRVCTNTDVAEALGRT